MHRECSRLAWYAACLCVVGLLGGCAELSTPPSTSMAPPTGVAPPEVAAPVVETGSFFNQPLVPGRDRVDYQLRPLEPGEPLVLMAISGGGSRSAYYAARVMEELSRLPAPGSARDAETSGGRNVLDSVRAISTVSAGGLAASYYITHFDQRRLPDFYEKFKCAMAVNLQWRTYGHMAMFPPLALQLVASSVTRTDLLAKEMEKVLEAENVTFDHLRVNETRPYDPAPVLLVNGTIYNSGQRLVMSNLPGSRFPSLLDVNDQSIAVSDTDQHILHNLVQPITFEDFGSDVGQFRLARAVAASAAYPMLLAPVGLQVYPNHVPHYAAGRVDPKLLQSQVAYVADGGLYENEGVDTLLSLLKTLPSEQPVLILIIDASQRMETLALGEGKVWGPTSVISRMYDIGTMRPLAFYSSLAEEFHDPKKLEAVVIRMEGYDAESERLLKNIPTSFKLSDEHRAALDQAAAANVARMSAPLYKAFHKLSSRTPAKPRRKSTLAAKKY